MHFHRSSAVLPNALNRLRTVDLMSDFCTTKFTCFTPQAYTGSRAIPSAFQSIDRIQRFIALSLRNVYGHCLFDLATYTQLLKHTVEPSLQPQTPISYSSLAPEQIVCFAERSARLCDPSEGGSEFLLLLADLCGYRMGYSRDGSDFVRFIRRDTHAAGVGTPSPPSAHCF